MEFVSLAFEKIYFFIIMLQIESCLVLAKMIFLLVVFAVDYHVGLTFLFLNSCFCFVYLCLSLLRPVHGFGSGSDKSELCIGK